MLSNTRKFAGSSSPKGGPGDDFFFIQQMCNHSVSRQIVLHGDSGLVAVSSHKGISLGVADGVGGWANEGIDPSLFPQALMYYAHQYSRSACAGEPEINSTTMREQIEGREMTPYECLDLAYSGVLREKQVIFGSSTACIISLNASSGVLRSANLGDSGYSIIRSNSIFYTSPPQRHSFNYTKQLGKPAEDLFSDPLSIADTHEVKLRDGDIVIVYTDGLSDNVFPSEIITLLCSRVAQAGQTEDEQIQNMADDMVNYAQRCMKNVTRVSPVARQATKEEGSPVLGGKIDDITVIVGLVRETS